MLQHVAIFLLLSLSLGTCFSPVGLHRSSIFFPFPDPVESVNSKYDLMVRTSKGAGSGSGYIGYAKMEYQSELFMNFTCGSKEVEKKDKTLQKWMSTNEFTIESWAEWGSDSEQCRHWTMPMNYVHCSNWKETDAGWTMLCNFMHKLKMRAYCVVNKDNQPTSLLTILAHPDHGTMSTVMTFSKPSSDPPSPSIFVPPSNCHRKDGSTEEFELLLDCNDLSEARRDLPEAAHQHLERISALHPHRARPAPAPATPEREDPSSHFQLYPQLYPAIWNLFGNSPHPQPSPQPSHPSHPSHPRQAHPHPRGHGRSHQSHQSHPQPHPQQGPSETLHRPSPPPVQDTPTFHQAHFRVHTGRLNEENPISGPDVEDF